MKNNVEYAFPIGQSTLNDGMELRDYFAAKAMQGLLTTVKDEMWKEEDMSIVSYSVADAMMKARNG